MGKASFRDAQGDGSEVAPGKAAGSGSGSGKKAEAAAGAGKGAGKKNADLAIGGPRGGGAGAPRSQGERVPEIVFADPKAAPKREPLKLELDIERELVTKVQVVDARMSAEVPLAYPVPQHSAGKVEFRMSPEVKVAVARLRRGLEARGEKLRNGLAVESSADAVRWWLERLVDGVGAFEQTEQGAEVSGNTTG